MKAFAELFTALDRTTKTNAKIQALVRYFEIAPDEDKIWAVALLSGRRPRRPVNTNLLRKWCAELAELPIWLFEDSYHVVGDLAETITLLLPESDKNSDKPLSEWMQELSTWRQIEETEVEQAVKFAWMELNKNERFVFNKLITGSFRIGVSQKLITRALSKHLNKEENSLAHRLMGNWKPDEISFTELLLEEHPEDDHSRPYPFYLAYPIGDEPQKLGDVSDWQIERKWDGIRGQLIVRGGELYVWSRGEELVTDKFPEFAPLRDLLPNGTVIDGEILAYEKGKPLNFQNLQTRIGRKNVSAAVLKKSPVILMAYDLIEFAGKDLRKEALSRRREMLEQLVQKTNSEVLIISEVLNPKNWDEAAEERAKSRENLSEGLMLKLKSGDYKVGRKRGEWWKWKIDPMTIDGVMIYAMRGHGRRANLYTDYTFAVWNDNELLPFAKAYSGLTDEEIRKVDNFVKRNTIERFGPVRSVKPELVFEIGFEGIAASSRHKSGIALRFPRILRWRKDKQPEDANSLDELKELL